MTESELRQTIVTLLCDIAPEIDPAQILPDVSFREQLDIDSMDFQNLMIALNKRTGVDVPERDYPKMTTLNGAVSYLLPRLPPT
ncbi:MAG: acyl carrier protein [Planctomycetes bacterium]|nr:acyl carrier protein [Planctomycetota bacterium]